MPNQGTEKFFQFALYITIYEKDLGLDRLSDQVEDILGSRLVYSRRVYYCGAGFHPPAFG
jgi:hypothetical protein